ncbi:hypothetical protein C8Q73DRAFT_360994 [Cubamyces lactineus]|nr:hypothetical protein C8Q73DRAFT_360994 [Cubamyces lactineus]
MPDLTASTPGFAAMFDTVGVVVLGGVLGVMLYGVTLHQVYRYLTMYPADRTSLKVFVIILLILETWHIVVWLAAGYHYNIEGHFTNEASLGGHWSLRLAILATTVPIGVTQCFYAWRVYLIGPHYKWLVTPALSCLVIYQGFAFAAGIKAFQVTNTVADFERLSWLVAIACGLSSITDVTLAATLVFVLHRCRVQGLRSSRTDTILDTLIKYTINTGLLTSIGGLLAFIFAIVLPGNLIYAGITIVGTKLYANSALAL